MQQSDAVMEWMDEGDARGRATTLLKVLESRFRALPPELTAAIRDTTASDKLLEWGDPAVRAASIEEFRQATGL